jgi:hypothetical protein
MLTAVASGSLPLSDPLCVCVIFKIVKSHVPNLDGAAARLSLAFLGVNAAQSAPSSHGPSQFIAFTRTQSSEISRFSLNDVGQLHWLSNRLDQVLALADAPHLMICAGDDKETLTAYVFV